MASVAVNKLSVAEKDQLVVSYASFVLSGVGAQVTVESLQAVIKAAELTASDCLVNAFAKAMKGKKTTDFLGSVGASQGAPQQTKEKAKKQAPKEAKNQAKKEAPPPPPPAAEDQQMDLGGMFD